DALAEQVLAEAPLLALEHVGEALERTLVRPRDRLAAAAVVEERVHRLLQHAALVPDDDLRRVQLEQALQAVVAVDDAAIQVVQIARREAATVEGHERTQIRRQHRDHRQHHPLGSVPAPTEGLDHLEPLGQLLALGLARRAAHLLAQLLAQAVDVHPLEHLEDGLAAHARREAIVAVLLEQLSVTLLRQELAELEPRLHRIDDDVGLAVQDLLEILERDVEDVPDAGGQALEEPNVRHGRRQVDVPEALTTHLGLDHLDAALLAHDPPVLHALVLAADALVVLHGPEDLRAEQAVPLRLEGPVVDRLRLLHLTVGPLPNLLGARQGDPNGRERKRILRLLKEGENVAHGLLRLLRSRIRRLKLS